MFYKLSLDKFKSFNELNNLQFKPITILCGTNSCGKSSVLQSILLFKQTLESQSPNQTILLNGRFVHLGTLENAIHRHSLDQNMTFRFSFNITKEEFRKLWKDKYTVLHYMLETGPRSKERDLSHIEIEYAISLAPGEKKSKKAYISPIEVDGLQFRVGIKELSGEYNELVHHSLKRSDVNGIYELEWRHNYTRHINRKKPLSGVESVQVSFANLVPVSVKSAQALDDGAPVRQMSEQQLILRHGIQELMSDLFSKVSYLGPLREEPARRYIYEDEVVEIGNKGENAAYIYLTQQDKSLQDHYFLNSLRDGFDKTSRIKLRDAITNWLTLMGISNFRPDLNNDIIQLSMNAGKLDKTIVNIADVGFGVSQIFPIVLEGLRMPIGNTLLLEQPEIHLHPKLQMDLADYFIALAKSGKRIVAETHSEHIVNRLVRRIVEDFADELKDLIGIYFVEPSENGATCTEICIDPKKGIVNWPKDFFDQTAREQEQIIRAGLAKRKKVSEAIKK